VITNLSAVLTDSLRLSTLHDLHLLDTAPEPAFDRLTTLATQVINAPISLVSLVDQDRQFFKSATGLSEPLASERQTPISHSFCKYVITMRQPLFISDARQDVRVQDNPAIADYSTIAYAGIPLITSSGQAIGTFCVIDRQPHVWTESEIHILETLAAAVLTEIELRSSIDALQKSEADLKTALEKEKSLNHFKSRFSSMMSHEFRTPLTTILLSSDLLKRYHHKMPEDRKLEHFYAIEKNVDHLVSLLDDILIISRAETVGLDVTPVRLHLPTFLGEILQDMRPTAGKHILHLEADDGLQAIWIDPKFMRQIMFNLLSNAIKYSPPESLIEVELSATTETVMIEVRDEGIGISEKDLEHLFESFYRADNTDAFGGTGLGLAIVKQLVEISQGTIECQSILGSGTTFTIRLPFASEG
jgi:signal transduction histidine kinase